MVGLLSKRRGTEDNVEEAISVVKDHGEALPLLEDPDGFAAAFDRFADAKVLLLGEATHGTSEFYRARAAITRRLIERHGFTIVAVEADWPDAAAVDRYVRHRPAGTQTSLRGLRKLDGVAEPPFQRFPQWMWRNVEVMRFIDWMRQHNESVRELDRRAGFY